MHKILLLILTTFWFTACSTNSGHTPDAMVIFAPIAKPANAISTAIYKRKQKRASAYLAANYDDLRNEAYNGKGEHLEKLIQLVTKDQNKAPALKIKIRQKFETLFLNSKGIVMRINLIATQASAQKASPIPPYATRIQLLNEIDKDYESFRLAIKNKERKRIAKTVELLSISESDQEAFYSQLFSQYEPLFIESVTQQIFYLLNTVK